VELHGFRGSLHRPIAGDMVQSMSAAALLKVMATMTAAACRRSWSAYVAVRLLRVATSAGARRPAWLRHA